MFLTKLLCLDPKIFWIFRISRTTKKRFLDTHFEIYYSVKTFLKRQYFFSFYRWQHEIRGTLLPVYRITFLASTFRRFTEPCTSLWYRLFGRGCGCKRKPLKMSTKSPGPQRCRLILQQCLAIQLSKAGNAPEDFWMYDSGYMIFQVRRLFMQKYSKAPTTHERFGDFFIGRIKIDSCQMLKYVFGILRFLISLCLAIEQGDLEAACFMHLFI